MMQSLSLHHEASLPTLQLLRQESARATQELRQKAKKKKKSNKKRKNLSRVPERAEGQPEGEMEEEEEEEKEERVKSSSSRAGSAADHGAPSFYHDDDVEEEGRKRADQRAAVKRPKTYMPDQKIDPVLRDLINTQPTLYCDVPFGGHPCATIMGCKGTVVADWVVQFDAAYFVKNPEGFFSLTGTLYNPTLYIMMLLSVLGVIAKQAAMPEFHVTERIENSIKIKTKEPIPKNNIAVAWERVPHKDDPTRIVAYRLRVTEFGFPTNTFGLLKKLVELVEENDTRWFKQDVNPTSAGRNRNIAVGPYHYSHMHSTQWRQLCQWYDVRLAMMPFADTDDETIALGRFSPQFVFTYEHACAQARRLGAHPAYCDPRSYARAGRELCSVRFPDGGRNTFQIDRDSISPDSLAKMRLPNVRPDRRNYQSECERFALAHGLEEDPVKARAIFDQVCNRSSTQRPANDMDALTSRVQKRLSDLRTKWRRPGGTSEDDVLPEFHAEWLHYRATEGMDDFDAIFNPCGDAPNAIRAIAAYFDEYVKQHGTLVLDAPQQFVNLDRFCAWRATDCLLMHSSEQVHTAQQDALLLIYSVLHVYSRVDMNIHHMLLGAPGIGKSFLLFIITKIFIEDSYKTLNHTTLRAFTAPGKENACLIMIFEDAQASTFGGKSGTLSKAASSSSDQASQIKSFLTSRTMTTQTIEMDPKRVGVTLKSETSCVVLIALNAPSSDFDLPIQDRFVVTESSTDVATTTETTLETLVRDSRVKEPAVRAAQDTSARVWHLRQAKIAKLFHMESCQILTPIDLSMADMVFALTAEIAAEHHLNIAERRRPRLRYSMMVRVLVALHAIDMVWETPESPLTGVPHRPAHFLMLDKYLFATVQISVFALGLMARMWQDNTRSYILEAMLAKWFLHHKTDLETFKPTDQRPWPVLDYDAPVDQPIDGQAASRPALREPIPPPNLPAGVKLDGRGGLVLERGGGGRPQGGGASAARNVLDSPEARDYAQQLQDYNADTAARKYWMYTTCHIGSGSPIQELPPGCKGTPQEIIQHLASKIHGSMSKHFLLAEVEAKLLAMTQTSIDIMRRRKTTLFPVDEEVGYEYEEVKLNRAQLIVEPHCIRLALPLVDQWLKHGNDILYRCVTFACSVITIVTKQPIQHGPLMYGECEKMDGARFVWRFITPYGPDQVQELESQLQKKVGAYGRMRNAGYEDGVIQSVTQSVLGSMDPDWWNPANLKRLFPAERPFSVMDTPLDSYAALLRAMKLGLSHDDQHRYPSNDPSIFERQLFDIHQKKHADRFMEVYPKAILENLQKDRARKMEADYQANPKPFLMSTSVDEMKKRQATLPSLLAQLTQVIETPPPLLSVTHALAPVQQPAAVRNDIVQRTQALVEAMEQDEDARMEADEEALFQAQHANYPSDFDGHDEEEGIAGYLTPPPMPPQQTLSQQRAVHAC